MPEQCYKDALKLGQKEYRACLSKGISPVLPVMDDFIPEERVNIGVKLGTVQIPVEFIVGTKTRGRTTSFARNFMPILPETTEFAAKWEALCQAHLKEGIRDAIKAYEYMNRFYVEEGNKRVSVLKFFGAVNITADVTRVMPERGTGPESDLYFEFLDFYRVSHINYIEFTKKGSYAALQESVGKTPDRTWSEEERRRFATVFHYFRSAYEELGGSKLSSTPGDAFLAFMKVYPYGELYDLGPGEMKKRVSKMWEEVKLQQEKEPIEVKPVPVEPKAGLITKVLTTTATVLGPLKVGFIHDKTPEVSGWTHGHDKGREYVDRVLGGQIETVSYFDAMSGEPGDVITKAVKDKCDLIFTTSPVLLPASLRAAVDNPDVLIMNCSINKSHRYVRTYYARIYEAKFIIGAVAGAMSADGRIGYVCDYPIYGQIAGINAFALGAKMVNPRARVRLEWSSVAGREAAVNKLTGEGIELISSMDNARLYESPGEPIGLSRVTGDKRELLASPIWNWGVYYEGLIRQVLNGALRAEYISSSKAINYYWGMSAGAVDVALTGIVPASVKRLAGYLKEGISRWIIDPFIGPIHVQGGKTVGEQDKPFSMEDIIAMDYLVEWVDGRIPVYEELSSTGKATVENVGVEVSRKSEGAV